MLERVVVELGDPGRCCANGRRDGFWSSACVEAVAGAHALKCEGFIKSELGHTLAWRFLDGVFSLFYDIFAKEVFLPVAQAVKNCGRSLWPSFFCCLLRFGFLRKGKVGGDALFEWGTAICAPGEQFPGDSGSNSIFSFGLLFIGQVVTRGAQWRPRKVCRRHSHEISFWGSSESQGRIWTALALSNQCGEVNRFAHGMVSLFHYLK